MVVVIFSNNGWSLFNFRINLIKSLLNKGHKVVISCGYDSYVSRLESIGCLYRDNKVEASSKNPFGDLFLILRLFCTYKKYRPDFVFNFSIKMNIYSSLVSIFFKTSVVNNIAGLGYSFIKKGIFQYFIRFLYKISQNNADLVFFQNPDDMDLFISNRLCSRDRAKLLPGSGVDLNRFNFDEQKIKKEIVFIYVGRLLYDKGIGLFVDCARYFHSKGFDDVSFKVLGFLGSDNPSAVSKNTMEQWNNENIIEYLGVSDDVENIVRDADCVVLPSYYREGTPRSLLEAAAMGRIVITTDSIGCREAVIDEVTGFLCEPRSLSSLIECAEKVLNLSIEDRKDMGAAARDFVENNFDENIVIGHYLNFIGDNINE